VTVPVRPVPSLDSWAPPSVPAMDATTPSSVSESTRSSRWSILLSLGGLGTVILTALMDQHLDPGLWGLPGSIFPTWYVGIAFILVGIALARHKDGVEVGVGVTALVVALTATPSIVYDLPRYAWTAKHVGVINFILSYGHVHPSIDIYQSWPGFFSAMAWICRVAGIHDPLVVARVWPPIIDVLTLGAARCLAGRLLANRYRAWMAAAAFSLSNAIGQDYFSPQSISLFLAISIFALVAPMATAEGSTAGQFRLPAWRISLVILLSAALAVTHQVTPFLVGAALVTLVVFGLLRPIWIPFIPLLLAAGWAILNLSMLKRYFSVSTIGSVTGNIATRGAPIAGFHADTVLRISSLALATGAIVVGLLAVAFTVRNHKRQDFALAICAASAGSLTFVTNYGNEGVFRVTLFALPWLCILAIGSGPKVILRNSRTLLALLALLVATFLFADTSLDGWYALRPAQIQAERNFEANAPSGSLLIGIGPSIPPRLTARYPSLRFEVMSVNYKDSIFALMNILKLYGRERGRVYVLTSESAQYYGELQGLYGSQYYGRLVLTLHKSPEFRTVMYTKAAQLFELKTPASTSSTGGTTTGR
jgi:hypothetical protein